MLQVNQIYCGDNVELCKQIDNNSIDMSIQSPPYDNLRKYKGFSWDFPKLAQELYRITKKGGVCIWVVGDATINGSETGSSFKQALYFKEVGWNLHDTMIYAKNNYVPLTHNRYEQQFEYMFIFSKKRLKTFNPIKIPTINPNLKNYRNYQKRKYDNESFRVRDEYTIVKNEKIKSNIWFYNVGFNQTSKDNICFNHPGSFPEELVKDHIISWSNPSDLVLDIFNGSGTTTKMAKLLKRNFIGIDCSEEYCNIAKERLNYVA